MMVLSTAQLQAIEPADFGTLGSKQLNALGSGQIGGLTTNQIVALTSAQVPNLGTAQVAALTTGQIRALETADFKLFGSAQLGALSTAQFVALTTDQILQISSSALGGLSTSNIKVLGTGQVQALTSAQMQGLNSAQMMVLSTAQLQAIEPADFGALGTKQLAALGTAQLRGITTNQIVAIQSSSIGFFSTDGIRALDTAQIKALTSGQIKGFSTTQIMSLTTAQVGALDTMDIAALSMAQAAVINIAGMSNAQITALGSVSPIVLDLNGDGVKTLSSAQGINFDLTGTGTSNPTGWVAPTDGLLALDLNHDGLINDGRELFGSATEVGGVRAGNGFAALRALDSNGDGKITAEDTVFAELGVWTDANQNGKTDAGEFVHLTDKGIVSLNLSAKASDAVDNGNLLGLVSSYQTADGSAHDMVDVWFRQGANASDELRSSVNELTQSLGSYLEEEAANSTGTGQLSLVPGSTGGEASNSGAVNLASSVASIPALSIQLSAYYQQQGQGFVANPLAQGTNASSLLSGSLSGGLSSSTAILASADMVKGK